MDLLAGSNTNHLLSKLWRHCGSEVHNSHGRDLWHKNLASPHSCKTSCYKINSLLQRDPETRHPGVGNGQVIRFLSDELLKERHDGAARAYHVAVTDHGKPRTIATGKVIRGN